MGIPGRYLGMNKTTWQKKVNPSVKLTCLLLALNTVKKAYCNYWHITLPKANNLLVKTKILFIGKKIL